MKLHNLSNVHFNLHVDKEKNEKERPKESNRFHLILCRKANRFQMLECERNKKASLKIKFLWNWKQYDSSRCSYHCNYCMCKVYFRPNRNCVVFTAFENTYTYRQMGKMHGDKRDIESYWAFLFPYLAYVSDIVCVLSMYLLDHDQIARAE